MDDTKSSICDIFDCIDFCDDFCVDALSEKIDQTDLPNERLAQYDTNEHAPKE